MRLTQIKLAGFKSFPDPVHVPVAGARVGVVGPNGCGKSNIIDAVRWVLGESQARHLRGESMEDVIFNGSGTRKPVGRASVELIFDNAAGRAGGQWSSFAEVAVKRVLHRNGESAYYINMTHVRRRDITDLFAGTGVGARAYAIIEQGMISRVIEAKPDELRVFLEEAAGISKYKDRRRETENRLADTRENLDRVNDIRRELADQIGHLETQAVTAQKYRELHLALTTAQHLLWLIRKRDAGQDRERLEQEVRAAVNRMEAEAARLAGLDAGIEEARAGHYAAGDSVNTAQGSYYAAAAEVSQAETRLAQVREARVRLANEIDELQRYLVAERGQAERSVHDVELLRSDATVVVSQVASLGEAMGLTMAGIPPAEARLGESEEKLAGLRRDLASKEQAREVEEAHRSHAARNLERLRARRDRLLEERDQIPPAEDSRLGHGRLALDELDGRIGVLAERMAMAEAELRTAQADTLGARMALSDAEREMQTTTAKVDALRSLQARLEPAGDAGTWMVNAGLSGTVRLWDLIDVEPGWETAVEAVLRERMGALILDGFPERPGWLSHPAPTRVVVVERGGGGGDTLLDGKVVCRDAGLAAQLSGWFAGMRPVADVEDGWGRRGSLGPAECFVTRDGHLVGRHVVTFFAADAGLHGVIERRREIESLEVRLNAQLAERDRRADVLLGCEARERSATDAAKTLGDEHRSLDSERQRLQVELARLAEAAERHRQRLEQVSAEIAEIETQILEEIGHEEEASRKRSEFAREALFVRETLSGAQVTRDGCAAELVDAREQHRQQERAHQEAQFKAQSIQQRIHELEARLQKSHQEIARAEERQRGASASLTSLDEQQPAADLQAAVEHRDMAETILKTARIRLDEATDKLRQLETDRQTCERGMEPLRSQIEAWRLKEQEARLGERQFSLQLEEAGADEATLLTQLAKANARGLQADITRFGAEIEALGAVNLAAFDELTSTRERTAYLDAQSADLESAIATLEEAILRIDAETRERLQATFDTVNASLGGLFATLFHGGHAELELTGDEILDAGVRIVAQPPGKRNTSIHLLSGGEKALTALALVFSLFKLNPAPFCLLDEVDAPLDDANTERFCSLVREMSSHTQFLFITHNRITMELAEQLVGITMQELGVSRIVAVDVEEAISMAERTESVAA